jgi:hypothetical protein
LRRRELGSAWSIPAAQRRLISLVSRHRFTFLVVPRDREHGLDAVRFREARSGPAADIERDLFLQRALREACR